MSKKMVTGFAAIAVVVLLLCIAWNSPKIIFHTSNIHVQDNNIEEEIKARIPLGWFACKESSDCSVIHYGCINAMSVRTAYQPLLYHIICTIDDGVFCNIRACMKTKVANPICEKNGYCAIEWQPLNINQVLPARKQESK